MENLPLQWAKQLYLRFTSLYGERFTKSHSTDQLVELWWEDWADGLSGMSADHIKQALGYCKLNLEWPPSVAEFRKICEKISGLPTADDALALAIRREFTHPVVKLAYEKVGSWAMKNDKQSDLQAKFKAAYQDALSYFRSNTQQAWLELENFTNQPKQIEPPSKIPNKAELVSFKERYRQWQAQAQVEKAKREAEGVVHPTWDKAQITKGARAYDEKVYLERKRYLLSIDEMTAIILPTEDLYDRTRYFREIEALNYIARVQSGVPHGKDAG